MNTTDQTTHNIKWQVVKKQASFEALEGDWNNLVHNANATVFQTYEWNHTWWTYFGEDNRLYILTCHDEDTLVGIFPLFLEHYRVAGQTVFSLLRMIGSNVLQTKGDTFWSRNAFTDYLDAIVKEGYEKQVAGAFVKALTDPQLSVDMILLEEVPEWSFLLHSFLPAWQKGNEVIKQDDSACPVVDFGPGWDELLAELSSNARYQVRRFVKRVDNPKKKLFNVEDVASREEVNKAFEQLVHFHQQRWNNLRLPGIFSDERITGFFREVTHRFDEKGWIIFKVVTEAESNKCLGVDLLFAFNNIIYMSQRGYDDESELNKYGPGNALLYFTMKEFLEQGYAAYDFLRGEEGYKMRMANRLYQNKRLALFREDPKRGYRQKIYRSLQLWSNVKRSGVHERESLRLHLTQDGVIKGGKTYTHTLWKRVANKIKKNSDQ